MSWSFFKKLQTPKGVSGQSLGARLKRSAFFRGGAPAHRAIPVWADARVERLELREGRSNIERMPRGAKPGDAPNQASVRLLDLDAVRAHVLTGAVGRVDYALFAETLAARFPRLGRVRYLGDEGVDFNAALETMTSMVAAVSSGRGDARAMSGDPKKSHAFEINGEIYTVTEVAFPLVYDVEEEGLHPFRSFDPRPAIEAHAAQLVIQAPKLRAELEWTKAQASVVTFFADLLAEMSDAAAVYWRASQCFAEPEQVAEAAAAAYAGEAPILFWVQFYPIYIEDLEVDDKRLWGVATQGMAPFTGREVESAPEPQEPFDALTKVGPVCEYMLNQSVTLRDGETLSNQDGENFHYVREVERFFRPDTPCFLLVSPDSIIDPLTLTPRE